MATLPLTQHAQMARNWTWFLRKVAEHATEIIQSSTGSARRAAPMSQVPFYLLQVNESEKIY